MRKKTVAPAKPMNGKRCDEKQKDAPQQESAHTFEATYL
jgi:hypothetical protein